MYKILIDQMNIQRIVVHYYTVKVGFTTFRIDTRYQNLVYQGDGSFGCVVSAFDTLTNRSVAIKKVRDPFLQKSTMKRLLREIKLLMHFNGHGNIVQLFDIMTDPPNVPEFNDLYLVTSLYETDMHGVIKSTNNLSEHHFQFFIHQTLRALKYIHSANVIHRDLKPSNILVNSSCNIAICDFGLGRSLSSSIRDPLTDYVVTRYYRAPELLCECFTYGKPVDIWSVGCIFAELITKTPFFRGETPLQQLCAILNKIGFPECKDKLDFIQNNFALSTIRSYQNKSSCIPYFGMNFPDGTSYLLLDLLSRMLQFNPEDRITVDEALNHPYLKLFQNQVPVPLCSEFTFNFQKSYINYDLIFANTINLNGVSQSTSIKRKKTRLELKCALSEDTVLTNQLSSSCACPTHHTALSTPNSSPHVQESMDVVTNGIINQNTQVLASLSEEEQRKVKINQMIIKEARYHILYELNNYRPLSQQMVAFLTYGNPAII